MPGNAEKTMRIRLPALWSLAALLISSALYAQDGDEGLAIERLTWAGLKLTAGDTTVLIDAIGTDIWNGNAPEGFVPVEVTTSRSYALVTHAHNDHLDVDTLQRVLGERGYVIAHESNATHLASRGLRVIETAMYHPVERGGFLFIPVPASDGFGEEQVSWIVQHGEHRILHGGDSLWHGKWDQIGHQFGPFDTVFLPINGASVQGDPVIETPRTMTPAQAIDAALLLRAKQLVPIHFGLNSPPAYQEVEQPLATLRATARERDVKLRHLRPGQRITVP